jgi:hypothetical protein
MKREYSFQKAPRCSATSKRTHQRCKAPAVRQSTKVKLAVNRKTAKTLGFIVPQSVHVAADEVIE